MSRKETDLDQLLDRTLAEIAEERMDPQAEQAAGERVWNVVRRDAASAEEALPANQQIRDCEDFQALLPAYIQGALIDAKALLIEDHTRECVPCRRALKSSRRDRPAADISGVARKSRSWVSTTAWRVAAAAAIFLAIVGIGTENEWFTLQAGGLVRIDAVEGELFHVTKAGILPLQAGDQVTLARGEGVRTAKGSRAMLTLNDGSAVEMDARAELGVTEKSAIWNRDQSDCVIDLTRGNIIVEAADQGRGRLFVETVDSEVAVTGTVFAVNSGVKGTRVSVIEGEVHVDSTGSDEEVLHAGDQTTSTTSLTRVPFVDEIAWSANAQRHLTLLREMVALGDELDRVVRPGLRYSTNLLDLAPQDTIVYIGIPNLSGALAEAQQVLEEKIASSEELQQWWNETVVPNGGDEQLDRIITKIRDYGGQLGEEIVVTLQMDVDGEVRPPVLLANLTRPDELRDFIEQELAELQSQADFNGDFSVRLVESAEDEMPDLGPVTDDPDSELFLWHRGGQLAVTFSRAAITEYAIELGDGRTKAAANTPFRREIRRLYDDGVQWVVGADIGKLLDNTVSESEAPEMEGFGLLDMQTLIAERKESDGKTDNRLVLGFSRERRGIAGWLDAPAPMGSLNFISANASLAAAFLMQEPATLVDDLFATLGSTDDDFEAGLAEFENEHGISIREDFAAPLGGEVAFAIDGPLVPNPSWKLILEVYDPARLLETLNWAIDQLNTQAAEHGLQGGELVQEESGGRTFYQLVSHDTGLSAHLLFEGGYLIVTPSRALLLKALDARDSGNTILIAKGFNALLPADAEMHFSAVAYQNLSPMLGPLVDTLGAASANFGEEQRNLVDQFAALTRPSLSVAYAKKSSISVTYTQEGGLFGSSLGTMMGFRSLLDMQELIGQAGE